MSISFLDLLQKDGVQPRKIAGTGGGEWASACPKCGGTDRFRVWPEQGPTGRYWCRGCNIKGDSIQYLRDVRGLTYQQACAALGVEARERSASPSPVGDRKPTWQPKEAQVPPPVWREKAAALIEWAEKYLWSPAGEKTLAWLRNERFLTDETIRAARLGWQPKDVWRARSEWGLDEQLSDKGKPKKVWIPAGLVIPLLQGREIHRVRVRRSGDLKGDESRYIVLPGSSSASMLLETNKQTFVIVESELDALLLWQDVGELITPVAMGSASVRPDAATAPVLRGADEILVALDSDGRGARESWTWWSTNFPKARRWSPVAGKDPGEMRAAGIDLGLWIQTALERVAQGEPSGHVEAAAVPPAPPQEAVRKPFYDSPLIPFAGGARVCEPCKWLHGFRCRHEDGPGTERPNGLGCDRFEAGE